MIFKRWVPWNYTITLVLREIRNPVKMYSKDTDYIKIPIFDEEIGYDIVAGDWISTNGKGNVKFCYKLNPPNRSLEYNGNLFEEND